MIKRGRKNVPQENVDCCHGGEGTIKVRRLLGARPRLPGEPDFSKDFESCMNFMYENTLPPGTSIGLHEHKGNEELYFVIEGRGEMTVDGETQAIEPGDVCLTKSGSSHAFRNIRETDLKCIVLGALLPEKQEE